MKSSATLFPIALVLWGITLAPWARAQAQDSRQEGPIEIEKCQTISQPGSYKLVNNLQAGLNADCLVITANAVTIDLAGFTIAGNSTSGPPGAGAGIVVPPSSGDPVGPVGITVRNGSISTFFNAVDLSSATGSIVEGLRVSGTSAFGNSGIIANGVVKGNTVIEILGFESLPNLTGIIATGTVTGNYVANSKYIQYAIGPGSTVIGNTAMSPGGPLLDFWCSVPLT
jgi:hypothetical protein